MNVVSDGTPQALFCHADDPQADKLLLVMEYAEAGPVMRGDRSTEKVPLAEGVALKFFRDVLQVRGVSSLLPTIQGMAFQHDFWICAVTAACQR